MHIIYNTNQNCFSPTLHDLISMVYMKTVQAYVCILLAHLVAFKVITNKPITVFIVIVCALRNIK